MKVKKIVLEGMLKVGYRILYNETKILNCVYCEYCVCKTR